MKLEWEKLGLVFNPKGKLSWAIDTALQPTPIILDKKIRVFAGFRDAAGVSRIGWVDLDIDNPMHIINYSIVPILDVGLPGAFDDNGVVPTAIVKRDDKIYLYYAGYQLVKNVRFIAFTGLAISSDYGLTFNKFKNTPVLDRTHDEFLFRAIHSILFEDGKWKVWYGGGSSFIQGENKTLPVYDIRYMESVDGINFPDKGTVVVKNELNEYRVGRPHVIKHKDKYLMFFGGSTANQLYRLAYAESMDGINWERKDEKLNIRYSVTDFDSDMSAYPSTIQYKDKLYLFYNGNEYGKQGFGLAVLKN